MAHPPAALVLAVAFASLLAAAAAQLGADPQQHGKFGSRCASDSDCTYPNAQCYFGNCQCRNTYSPVNGSCFRKVGDNCEDDFHCDAIGAECNRELLLCKCGEGKTASGDGTTCYKIPTQQGDSCTRNNDCSFLGESAGCLNGRCGCRDANFVPKDNVCKRKIDELGAECNPRTDACYLERNGDHQHVECINSQCQCKDGYKESEDKQSCNKGSLLASSLGSVIFILMAKIFA